LDDAMRRAATPMSAIRGQRPGEDPVAARPIKSFGVLIAEPISSG
jgi:hypothetical protein